MRHVIIWSCLWALIGGSVLSSNIFGADKISPPGFENDLIRLRLMPRSPEQMAGFFEARGFPIAMANNLSNYCFFTVVIKNKSNDVLWLDLSEWKFLSGQQRLHRFPRSHWLTLWKKMDVPQASQATFRWTLLPEELDFRPDEGEGGNIILEKTDKPFLLQARFAQGKNKNAGMVTATINHLRCSNSQEADK